MAARFLLHKHCDGLYQSIFVLFLFTRSFITSLFLSTLFRQGQIINTTNVKSKIVRFTLNLNLSTVYIFMDL